MADHLAVAAHPYLSRPKLVRELPVDPAHRRALVVAARRCRDLPEAPLGQRFPLQLGFLVPILPRVAVDNCEVSQLFSVGPGSPPRHARCP